MVWYPPVSEAEEVAANASLREKIAKRLKRKLGISLEDYPKDKLVYIWKIAQMLKQRERES